MTEWSAIEPRFTRLRDFVLTDLEGFAANERGGNFALTALVLAACDALARLRYGGASSGHRILERCLPEEWKPASSILYDALRNGLIHGYDAKFVVADGVAVGFSISWYGESVHMRFATAEKTLLFIDAPTLVASLKATFDEVELELRSSAELRDAFFKHDRVKREKHLSPSEVMIWRGVVLNAQVANQPGRPGTPSPGAMGWGGGPPGPPGPPGPVGPAGDLTGPGATGPMESDSPGGLSEKR